MTLKWEKMKMPKTFTETIPVPKWVVKVASGLLFLMTASVLATIVIIVATLVSIKSNQDKNRIEIKQEIHRAAKTLSKELSETVPNPTVPTNEDVQRQEEPRMADGTRSGSSTPDR